MMGYKRGDKDTRPWGTWEVLDVDAHHAVKRVSVLPGKILSLQLHHHRDEHWIIVKGTATVTVGAQVFERKENEAVFIPRETRHRIANNTNGPLEFIEVQTGPELREDDIVRLEDAYGRV
jgi:mannose-6-phosphate isomerase-like protein (cupin superfamily)